MTQEFHISVTPLRNNEYLVRTEHVPQGGPLAEEQMVWSVDEWLNQAGLLMNDPLVGVLQGDVTRIGGYELPIGKSGQLPTASEHPAHSLLELGRTLHSALFVGTLRDSWMMAQGIAQHRGEVLRLRLGLKGSRLARLPWEVMHRGESPVRPIATGIDVLFSRYQPGIDAVGRSLALAEPEQPLRILMAIAAPTDQEQLELKREAMHLQQELRYQAGNLPGGLADTIPELQLTVLEQPSREQLTQALEQGQYQVFHYAGHSNLGNAGGALYLVNSRTGLSETLSGDDLAGLLSNNGIRMAVFNSCRGAHTAAMDAMPEPDGRNLAEALVGRGIPAVLAMAERIPDDVALTLTRLFYRNLRQGYPVDLSLSRARQGLISAYGSHQLYWALPILYLHPAFDGYLTVGDRSIDNPADCLVRLPGVFDAATAAAPAAAMGAATGTAAGEMSISDMAMPATHYLSPEAEASSLDGSLSEEELSELVETLEYDHEFSDDEDFNYAEDASLVADLIQQVSHPSPDAETLLPAAQEEILLPDADEAKFGEIYDNLPAHPQSRSSLASAYAQPDEPRPDRGGHDLAVRAHGSDLSGTFSGAPMDASGDQSRWSGRALPGSTDQAQKGDGSGFVQRISHRSLLLPLASVVGVLAIALVGFWAMSDRLSQSFRTRPSDLLSRVDDLPDMTSPSTTVAGQPVAGDGTAPTLAEATTADVTAIAIEHFNQGDLQAGELAVEELLTRVALPQATAALSVVSPDRLDEPSISFLLGRLAWQSVQVGNTDFSLDDARRYWETAVRGASDNPGYQTALGFALYAEAKPNEALQSLTQALSILEASDVSAPSADAGDNSNDDSDAVSMPSQQKITDDMLTTYAGVALALFQLSQEPGADQSGLESKAIKLYQMVMRSNPIDFQAGALAQDWLWTEAAIQDWQSLATLTP